MIDAVRVLVEAGATAASAAYAVGILENGGSVYDAERALVSADEPEVFTAELLLAALAPEKTSATVSDGARCC